MKSGYKYERVLVIEDNDIDTFICTKTLEATRFSRDVSVHSSARSALEYLHTMCDRVPDAGGVFPEVIFVDLHMPVMDGFQFLHRYKNTAPKTAGNTRLVVLTSSIAECDEYKAKEIDPDIVFLRKPITEEMLTAI